MLVMVDRFTKSGADTIAKHQRHGLLAVFVSEEKTGLIDMNPAAERVDAALRNGATQEGLAIKNEMWWKLKQALREYAAFGVIVIGEGVEARVDPSKQRLIVGGDEPGMEMRATPDPHDLPHEEILFVSWCFRLDGAKETGMRVQTVHRGPAPLGTIVLGEPRDLELSNGVVTQLID